MTAAHGTTNRLFRHDGIIAINSARAILAGWWDRLIAAAMLVAALASLRGGLIGSSWTVAAWTACGGAVVFGFGARRLIAARLCFHGSDGLLAADALSPAVRQRYGAAWHGIGLAVLTMTILIARPWVLVAVFPGYLAGALIAWLLEGIRMPGPGRGGTRTTWLVRTWLQAPAAGVVAALILFVSLLSARTLEAEALLAVAAIEAVLLGLALTAVGDDVVRFMAIAGHGSLETVARHAKSLAAFAILAVPGAGMIVGPVAAGIVAALSMALLLFLGLRVLAYRLHGKRVADVLVTVVVGLILLVSYSVPVALPFVMVAVVWHLHRRGRAKTWLLT